jgi:homocitrate synthase NifV
MTTHLLPAILINDVTLRECERLDDMPLTASDRIGIARTLERAGVDEISIGIPWANRTAIDGAACIAAALRHAKPILCGEMTRQAVDLALRTGIGSVQLIVPLTTRRLGRDCVVTRIKRTVGYACERGLRVAVGGADASRADFDLVCEAIAAAEYAGADRFHFADTVGVLHPLETYRLFRRLCAETDLELEFHGNDAFGLATANTLAAVQAGATHVTVSMLGRATCMRAATAPLDSVVSAISLSPLHRTHVMLGQLPALSRLLTDAMHLLEPDAMSEPSAPPRLLSHQSDFYLAAAE